MSELSEQERHNEAMMQKLDEIVELLKYIARKLNNNSTGG